MKTYDYSLKFTRPLLIATLLLALSQSEVMLNETFAAQAATQADFAAEESYTADGQTITLQRRPDQVIVSLHRDAPGAAPPAALPGGQGLNLPLERDFDATRAIYKVAPPGAIADENLQALNSDKRVVY